MKEEQEIQNCIDGLFSGDLVYMPERLVDFVENNSALRRAESREARYIMYAIICGSCTFKDKKPAHIHSRRFRSCSRNPNKVKQDLKANKFIKHLPRYLTAKAAGRRRRSHSQGYLPIETSREVPVRLQTKNLRQVFTRDIATEPILSHYADSLDLLEIDQADVNRIFKQLGLGKEQQRVSYLQTLLIPLFQLRHRTGHIGRGRVVNRVFSPLVNLKKELRHSFTIDGSNWALVDMQCCQPTLLACMSGDDKWLNHCYQNTYYQLIADYLVCDREEAKEAYCAYAYGPIRKAPTNSRTAEVGLAVQEFMASHYPVASRFVMSEKKKSYRALVRKLQNWEADIFVDQILKRLSILQIPSVTIHDSILVAKKNVGVVEEIANEIIADRTGTDLFKLKTEMRRKPTEPIKMTEHLMLCT